MSDSKRNCQICPLCGKLYKGTDNLVEYNGEKMCRNCYGILEREFFPIEGIDPDGEENPDYQEGYRQGASYMNRQWMRKIIQHYKKPINTTTIEERANVPQNRIPMNEEYLLDRGFLKEVDEELALAGFVTPNERIIVGSHRPYKTFPYDWFVIVKNQSMNDNIGSLDFAYVDQFETFLKLCGVDYEGK